MLRLPMSVEHLPSRIARTALGCALLLGACSFPDYGVLESPLPSDVPDHCGNKLLDRELGETDFDCGGGCTPCPIGRTCQRDVDCTTAKCSVGVCAAIDVCQGPTCAAPTCVDGQQNGDETDVDCGGECLPCDYGQAGCSVGHADCNNDDVDACETDLRQDPQHCGACTTSCGSTHATTTSCVAGACQPTCEPGFAACGMPERGCATQLGTSQNCAQCGDVCGPSAPYCASSGCQSYRDIVVNASSPNGMQGWNGTGAAPVVSVQHTVQYDKGQSRVVLVGVAASGTGSGPFTITYDDQPMVRALELEHESRQTYAAIYYLLDDKLPRAGSTVEVRAEFHDSAWWGFGGIDVLEAANVAQKEPLLTGSSAGATCDGTASRGVNLAFDAPGSLVYGVLSVRHAQMPPTLLQAPPVTKAWSQSVSNGGDPHSGAASWVIDDNTRNLQWSLNGCDTSVSVGVVLERLHAE